MKKLLALLLVVSMIFTMVACEKSAAKTEVSSDKSDTTYSVTDSREKTVTFNKTPKKIISLLPSDTEIVYALGFGDKLIAVSEYCNYPSDTENKKKLASGSKTSIESIIAEQPDLVIFGKMAQTEEQVISRNPDYIFATDMYSTPDPIGEIMGRTSWYNINAIKNNKVFSADADALTRPGPRLVDAAKELYTKIYE